MSALTAQSEPVLMLPPPIDAAVRLLIVIAILDSTSSAGVAAASAGAAMARLSFRLGVDAGVEAAAAAVDITARAKTQANFTTGAAMLQTREAQLRKFCIFRYNV